MAIKVKEMKDDAIVNVPINKNFYLMTKAVLLHLVNSIEQEDKDAYIKEILSKKYNELDEAQKSFYTIGLLLAEIENQAKTNNLYEDKEVLEPGDEGYVAPKLD